jgi:putative transposase
VVMLQRSMWYFKPKARDDKAIRSRILEISQVRIRYGIDRIYVLLRIYRIYKEEGLNLRTKRPKRIRAAAHRYERPAISNINQCWSMDFISDQLFDGRRFRALTIVDNYSRK